MNFNYKLSDKILHFIKDAKLEEISIGCSDSQVFKINKEKKIYRCEYCDSYTTFHK